MKKTTTLQASLVITLIGLEDPTEVIHRTLTLIEQLNLSATIGFPSAWLPSTRLGVNHPFPQLTDELVQRLWKLIDNQLIHYIPTGFSGAGETCLPDNLLEKERSWTHRPAHRYAKEDASRFTPLIFSLAPDIQRPIGLSEYGTQWKWLFQGWILREGIWLAQWISKTGDLVSIPWIDGSTSTVPLMAQVKTINQTFGISTIPIIHGTIVQPKDLIEFEKAIKKATGNSIQERKDQTNWSWFTLIEGITKSKPIPIVQPRPSFSSPVMVPISPCLSIQRFQQKNSPLVEQLSQYAQSCTIDSIPVTQPTPVPERELIASMLGSATLMGDFMEAQFENGLLVQLRGTFGGTRGMGVRVPALELEHRKIYWNVESAFSFETINSRGLRQVSVLTNELFTHAGRMVSDYIFFDDFPALVVDVRVHHPWIDKAYPIDQYIPWPFEIWQHPKENAVLFQGLLPRQSDKTELKLEPSRSQPTTAVIQDYSNESPNKSLFRFFSRQSVSHQRAYLPAQAWDMPCAQGTLRVRRADTLLDQNLMIPGQIITSAQQANFSVTLCPTYSYFRIDSDALRGIQEHFCILIYDPDHELEILASVNRRDFKSMYTPWLVRA
jgi:hypothetical protein